MAGNAGMAAAQQLAAGLMHPPSQIVTTDLLAGASHAAYLTAAAHPMSQHALLPPGLHPQAELPGSHGRLLFIRPGPGLLPQHQLLQQPGSPGQMLLVPQSHWNDLALLHQQQQAAAAFAPARSLSRFDSLLPNLDPAHLISSQDAAGHGLNPPMTAAAAAAAFGSAVGLDMLVEPSAHLEAAGGLMGELLGADAAVAGAQGGEEDGEQEEDEDDDGLYVNLLDGTAPEGLYQVTRARAEGAVPLEAGNAATGEGSKRCDA